MNTFDEYGLPSSYWRKKINSLTESPLYFHHNFNTGEITVICIDTSLSQKIEMIELPKELSNKLIFDTRKFSIKLE